MKEMLKDIFWGIAVLLVVGVVWWVLAFLDRRLDDGTPFELPTWIRIFG